MNKINFIVCALLSSAVCIAQTPPQPTRIVQSGAWSSDVVLDTQSETYYYYRPDGKLDFEETNNWNGTSFANRQSRTYYSYNAAGYAFEALSRQWDAGTQTYIDQSRHLYTYDAFGNKTEDVFAFYTSGVWTTQYISTMSYTPFNELQEQTLFNYAADGSIVGGFHQTNAVDANYLIVERVFQNYQGGAFVNQSRMVLQYLDADMVADYWEESGWDAVNNLWLAPVSRTTRTATAQQVVSITELNNGGIWGVSTRSTSNYDNNGLLLANLSETWNATTQNYEPANGVELSYNPDQSNLQFRSFRKDFTTGVYFQHLQLDYEYDLFVGESSPELQVETSVFPNPTTDRLEVRLNPESPTDATFNYTLADQNGRIVESRYHADKQETFFMQHLPAGVYFLRIEQDGAMKTLPVVKM